MISDEQVEKAVHYMKHQAKTIGELLGAKSFYGHKIKTVLADEFNKQDSGAVEAKKQAAIASKVYRQAIDEERQAISDYEEAKLLYKAAEMTIEIWRTQQANNRRGHF